MASNVVAFGNPGHNKPPLSKEDYTAAIHGWLADKRNELSREEIAGMAAFDRVDAHRKAYLLGLAQYYRAHPRADVVMGVYAIVMFMSDNDKGVCTMGQAKIAQILNRSRQTVVQAMQKLQDAGLVHAEMGKAQSHPSIPRTVTDQYNHLVWALDAIITAPKEEKKSGQNIAGLQRGPVRSSGQAEPVRPNGQVGEGVRSNGQATCPLEPSEPVRSNGPYFTKDNSIISDQAHEREGSGATRPEVAVISPRVATRPQATGSSVANPPSLPLEGKRSAADLDVLRDALMDAGGEALADPAASPGLIMLGEPQRWLAQGCDLEGDILPAIRACTARMPARSIRNWGYFTQAVVNAKAARLAPLPPAEARTIQQPKSWAEKREQSATEWLLADLDSRRGRGPAQPRYEQDEEEITQ